MRQADAIPVGSATHIARWAETPALKLSIGHQKMRDGHGDRRIEIEPCRSNEGAGQPCRAPFRARQRRPERSTEMLTRDREVTERLKGKRTRRTMFVRTDSSETKNTAKAI